MSVRGETHGRAMFNRSHHRELKHDGFRERVAELAYRCKLLDVGAIGF